MSETLVSERARVRRAAKRAVYDRAVIYDILDAAVIAHIGYTIDGQPYVTPTGFWREGDYLYWHGARASRMTQAQARGLAVCLTVTHLDGFVLARSGFHHSVNYRSAMLFGESFEVSDPLQRITALNRFVERIFPGRTQQMRAIDASEINATTLIGMHIDEASAKVRSGPPVDDAADLAAPIWAGQIRLQTTIAELIPDQTSTYRADPLTGLVDWTPGKPVAELLSVAAQLINSDSSDQRRLPASPN